MYENDNTQRPQKQATNPRRLGESRFSLSALCPDEWAGLAWFVLVFFWCIALIYLLFGINLFETMSDEPRVRPAGGNDGIILLILTGLLTTVLIPFIIYRCVLNGRIKSRGVRVPCVIVSDKHVLIKGRTDVTLEYSFESRVYRRKISVGLDQLHSITHVILDPKNPKHIVVQS